MARKRRALGRGEAYYHITSRIVDKVYRFTPEENERNVDLLRCVEEFSCVQVLSFCFMSDHFHILLRVPVKTREFTEDELLDRIEALYGTDYRKELKRRWEWAREHDRTGLVDAEKATYTKRMYNMGEFMKTLKQRLTMSYNTRHGRDGTLWESRYHSVLVEGLSKVLTAVAAYIDLNPVRAKMVSDPAKYTFSSYGEACRGKEKARAGLSRLYQDGAEKTPSWTDVAPAYRTRLVLKALPDGKRAGMTLEDIQQALEECGSYTMEEILSDRRSFFTRGFAIGSTDYIRIVRSDIAEREKTEKAASNQVPDAPVPC